MDGVIAPFTSFNDPLENVDSEITVDVYSPTFWFNNDEEIEPRKIVLSYRKKAVEFLSELSFHPLIDFVWLTAWRFNAPNIFDEKFNINSIGYLPWQNKRSDYNHVFKRVAILEDQEKHPSKFIWFEDLANKPETSWNETNEPIIGSAFTVFDWRNNYERTEKIPLNQYLSIHCDHNIGLTDKQIIETQEWLENEKLNLK